MTQWTDRFEKFCRKVIPAILFWFIILALGIIADLEHYEKIYILRKCKYVRETIIFFRKYGLHYSNALQLLKGSFGILITAVNFIFTMSINIADRSDKKVFGFSRHEFKNLKRNKIYRCMKRMTYPTPFLLAVAIILDWCITGYIILLFGYVFLLYNHVLYEKSYGTQKEIELFADYLSNFLYQHNKNGQVEYERTLECIRGSAEKEGNWREVSQLYEAIRKRAFKLRDGFGIIAVYRFFDIVYATNISSGKNNVIEQVKIQTKKLEQDNQINEEKYIVLFGMWNAIFERFDKESIINLIEWFSKVGLRSYHMIMEGEQKIEDKILEAEAGLLLICIENWFLKGQQELDMEIDTIKILWERGNEFLQKENSLFNKCFTVYENRFGVSMERLKESYEQLCKDIKFNGSLSRIGSILE